MTREVRLRAPSPDDIGTLVEIFATADVSRWWPDMGEDDVAELVGDPDDDLTVFVIEVEGIIGGVLQVYEENDAEYRHAGIDLMVTPALRGKGVGPAAIRSALEWIAGRGHHRVVIDPDASNASAIRAYEKVGFKPVGIMRQYNFDRTLEKWTDGLLMDLLIEEWRSAGDDPEL